MTISIRLPLLSLLAVLAFVPSGMLHAESTSYLYKTNQSEVGKYWIEARILSADKKCYTFDIDSLATKAECDAELPDQMARNKDWTFFGKCEQVTKTQYTYTFDAPICAAAIQKYGLTLVSGGAAATNPGEKPGGPTNPGEKPGGPTNPGEKPGGPSGVTGLTNPLNNIDSLPDLLEAVLGAIVQIGTIILTLALVYVGFLFVVAQGKEEKIRDAKNALLWTVVGGLILLGASAIGAVIKATVGGL